MARVVIARLVLPCAIVFAGCAQAENGELEGNDRDAGGTAGSAGGAMPTGGAMPIGGAMTGGSSSSGSGGSGASDVGVGSGAGGVRGGALIDAATNARGTSPSPARYGGRDVQRGPADAAMTHDEVPPDLRGYVRDYFAAIAPAPERK